MTTVMRACARVLSTFSGVGVPRVRCWPKPWGMDQDNDPADPTPRDRALAGELSFEVARAVFRPSGHWNRWEQREGVASGDLQRAGWGTGAESALLECYRQK